MDNNSFQPDIILTERKNVSKVSNGNIEIEKNGSKIIGNGQYPEGFEKDKDVVGLKREIGLIGGVSLIIGIMIGSGIFVSPGGVLAQTGSVGVCLLVWIACGILSTLGAMTFIELGTVVPSSGAEYAYLFAAFGPLPAFLYAWISTIVLKPSGVAIICLAFAQYCIGPFLPLLGLDGADFEEPSLKWAQIFISSSTLLLVTYINCASVSIAMTVQKYFTAAKLVALGIIICGGTYNLSTGQVGLLNTGFEGSRWEYGPLATAFYSGLWAFDGWNSLNYITEELKNPHRNLPLAILIALPLVTVFYLLVNVSYLTVASFDEMISDPVAITFGNRMLGPMAWLMPFAVAISTFAAANGSQFTSGRLCYVAAREGHLVECLSYIDAKRNTPSLAIVFNATLGILMTVFLDIAGLIDFFSFTAWIFYGSAVAAVIRLRFTRPNAPRPFKVPIVIPIIVVLISIFLVIAPVVHSPKVEYLYAIGFILIGFFVYFPFCHYKIVIPGMGKLTHCMQLLFQVIPPENDLDPVTYEK